MKNIKMIFPLMTLLFFVSCEQGAQNNASTESLDQKSIEVVSSDVTSDLYGVYQSECKPLSPSAFGTHFKAFVELSSGIPYVRFEHFYSSDCLSAKMMTEEYEVEFTATVNPEQTLLFSEEGYFSEIMLDYKRSALTVNHSSNVGYNSCGSTQSLNVSYDTITDCPTNKNGDIDRVEFKTLDSGKFELNNLILGKRIEFTRIDI